MFKVGDRIVYPMHGAGFVEGIELQTVGGVQREYYCIHVLGSTIRLKVPVATTGTIQLRPVIDREQAIKVLEYFSNLEIDMSQPWGKRYKENVDRLKTGIPEEMAWVAKTLMLRDKNVGLSIGDRQVMLTAKNIFTAELSLALNMEHEDVQKKLTEIVNKEIDK